jgi:hypothetical protein
MNKMIYIFIIALLSAGCSKNKKQDLISQVFTKGEVQTVDKIVHYYDSIIVSRQGSLDENNDVYKKYLDNISLQIENSGDISKLLPEEEDRVQFLRSLNQDHLKEFYLISDSIICYDKTAHKRIKVYSPCSVNLNQEGKFMVFLRLMAKEKEFISENLKAIEIAGDFSPTNYSNLISQYDRFNFKNRDEKLYVIISLLIISRPCE